MVFNRGEECTKDEKEYYNTIGKYTLVLSIVYVISLLISLLSNKWKISFIFIILFFSNVANVLFIVEKIKKDILFYTLIVFACIYIVYLIIFWFFLNYDKPISNILEYPLYTLCGINIIILVLFWLFGPCEKIYHDCNVESWSDEFKEDDLKSGREDFCNNLNETCMNDKNKSEDKCGTCSDSKYNNKEDCNDNDGEWTSRYTKCFWSKPSDKKVTSCDITTDSPPLEFHEGSCVYDLDKCASINCNDFQPTSVFYDCCEENTRGWQENMDCDTLRSQIDANKTEEGRIGGGSQRAGELEAEYNLRVAASSQTSNIHDQDLYE